MPAKKTTAKPQTATSSTLVRRKGGLTAGKRATLATKTGFKSCIVLVPAGVATKGAIQFEVALRIAPAAGKVAFVPRGKETIVIDAVGSPSTGALSRYVREIWDKKGGSPPVVVD
jgi:hypothetical protein